MSNAVIWWFWKWNPCDYPMPHRLELWWATSNITQQLIQRDFWNKRDFIRRRSICYSKITKVTRNVTRFWIKYLWFNKVNQDTLTWWLRSWILYECSQTHWLIQENSNSNWYLFQWLLQIKYLIWWNPWRITFYSKPSEFWRENSSSNSKYSTELNPL